MPLPRSDIPLTLAVTASYRHVSDADVGRGLIAGQSWAIAETWHRFAPMVLTTAERALGSRAEAQDIAQEVFCRLYRKARTLREPESLRSFVFSFAIRVLKSELRSRKARGWLSFHRPEALVDVARTPRTSRRAICCGGSMRASTVCRRAIGWCSLCATSSR